MRRYALRALRGLSVFALLTMAAGCDRSSKQAAPQGEAPPPVKSARPGLCAGGGGKVADKESAAFFVRKIGDYCVDPNGETRAYGVGADEPLDAGCGQFDGECPVYKRHGLDRLVMLRYADGGGSTSSVEVKLSRFKTKAGAFGFFTQRLVGDWDPVKTTVKPLDAGAAGAIGSGNAYVWRGRYVAELDYRSLVESPAQQRLSARKVLVPIAQALGDKLPGDRNPPAVVVALPDEHRVPQGVVYETGDALGIKGVGPGAVGYYKDGDRRWRVLLIKRGDEAAADDIRKTLRAQSGASKLEGVPIESFALKRPRGEAPAVEWVVAQRGPWLAAIGDEPLVLSASLAQPEQKARKLTRVGKLKRLKALVSSLPR